MSDNKENVPTPVQEEVKHVDSPPAEEAKAEVAKKAEEKPTPANAGEDSPKKEEKQPEPITDEPEKKAEEKPIPANAGEDSPKKKEKQPEPVTDKPETSADAKSVSDVGKEERTLLRQLEYSFLCEPMANYEDEWVPLSALLKRMTSPEKKLPKVMEALNNSDGGLLQLSEDKQSVRRHPKEQQEMYQKINELSEESKPDPKNVTKEEEEELLDLAGFGCKRHGDGGDPKHDNKKPRLE